MWLCLLLETPRTGISTLKVIIYVKPIVNLSCFQKGAYYAGIMIFNGLPFDLKGLMNEKAQFKIALKQYLSTHSFYSVDEYLLCRK
jgi:hypothetical protein